MVNYIVALYLGRRRNGLVQECMDKDPFYLFKSHMLAVHKYKMEGVHKVTFVLNPSENKEAEKQIDDVFAEYTSLCSNKNIEFNLIRNSDNKHISYGAWHYGVVSGLNDERTQHFFLLEDDYVPCSDNFHQPYVDKSGPDIAYVCQMWRPANVQKRGEPKGRVAITNGLLNANLSREIFKKHNKCFTLQVTGEYNHLSNSKKMDDISKKYLLSGPAQKHFVGLYLENGNQIVDLGSNWQQPFLTTRTVRMYGEGNPPTIYPVHEYVPITPESFK